MSKQNAATTIEKFVATHLTRIAVEPYVAPSRPQAARDESVLPTTSPISRKKSFALVGPGAVVFVCGMAVGYLMSAQSDVPSLQAKAPSMSHGAARLRIDYDLRNR